MHIAASFSAPFFAQAAPVATTGAAESVTTGSAVVNGTVDPNGEATRYWVEYGTTSSYGVKSAEQVTVGHDRSTSGHARRALRAYHLPLPRRGRERLRQSAGVDRALRTAAPAAAPSIASRAATGVNVAGRDLDAGVNPRGPATTVRFEYGTSTSYGPSTPEQAIGAGSSTVSVTAAIAGLKPGTRYNYRAVATSARGHRARRQPRLHHLAGADRRRDHALDGAPDLGLGAYGLRHGVRGGLDPGRAREAGLPVHRRLRADRDRDRQQQRRVHADRAAVS